MPVNYGFSRGYMLYTEPDKANREHDTFTCGHCNVVTKIPIMCDPADLGGLCRRCMRLICQGCQRKGECDPIDEKLRRAESRQEALRSYGF